VLIDVEVIVAVAAYADSRRCITLSQR